jgi:hypothetical protein
MIYDIKYLNYEGNVRVTEAEGDSEDDAINSG